MSSLNSFANYAAMLATDECFEYVNSRYMPPIFVLFVDYHISRTDAIALQALGDRCDQRHAADIDNFARQSVVEIDC